MGEKAIAALFDFIEPVCNAAITIIATAVTAGMTNGRVLSEATESPVR
jgi:hypothetical protein